VPFFGDQFFWGERIHARRVGPAPIPIAELTVESLSNAIRFMLDPEVELFLVPLLCDPVSLCYHSYDPELCCKVHLC
jgi:hypothetical protein